MYEPSAKELALGYIYQQELDAGDLRDIEIVEGMIAQERLTSESPLYLFVMQNVINRMTSQQWQTAIGQVCETIAPSPSLSATPAPPTDATEDA